MSRARSLRGRLALALTLTALVSTITTALITVGLVRKFAAEDSIRDLEAQARTLVGQADRIDRRGAELLTSALLASGNLYALLLQDGSIVTEDDLMVRIVDAADLAPLPADRVRQGPRGRVRSPVETRRQGMVSLDGREYAYVGLQGGRGPMIVLARPAGLDRQIWVPVALRTSLAALVAVAIAVVASVFIARRLARPIAELAVASEKISTGDLGYRVAVESSDELGALARSFNDMAGSLGEARRREREFLASISHELKTPLTVIRGYAEALRDRKVKGERKVAETAQIIESEADRLDRIVGDVMDLARLGAGGLSIDLVDVDVGRILHQAADAHSGRSDDVEVTASSEESLFAKADPTRLRQILDNLIENAMRVVPGSTAISLSGYRKEQRVFVEVRDEGPGISPDDLPHVFERSYLWKRYQGERKVGTGFGLAIVRELATAMGATVEVSSAVGAGTIFTLALPAA